MSTAFEPVIGRSQIEETGRLISPYIRRTPVIDIDASDFGLDPARLSFKLELLQHSGSFKVRGAFANLLTHNIPRSGVVAASGGNHGAAVAYAAKRLSIPAKIFVPSVTSPTKLEQIRVHGADLVVTGERYADALAASEEWIIGSGGLSVHAYDQLETLLGQGTLAMELEEQAAGLDTVIVAVGGGGLIGGIAAWYAGRVKVVGVEPEAAPTLHEALKAGQPVNVEVGGIAAESLGARSAGRMMFPIAQRHVSQVVLVTDDAIREAQQALWKVLRVAAEPGGAAAFAALASGRYRPEAGERVGIIICGGNTAAVDFGK